MENIEEIYSMTITELWAAYNQTIIENPKEFKTTTDKIKNGIKINIPIEYYTKQYYEENPSNKNVKVLGYGKYNIQEFWQEEEDRKAIMIQTIIEENKTEEPTKPR